MSIEAFHPADFTDYAVGDRIHFWTNDNGYGGYGEIWRTGTVTKVTDKTITIACDTNGLGNTARIRRADYWARCPSRSQGAESTPTVEAGSTRTTVPKQG